ncbi:MAG TPA: methyltransferase domain-containing protein [Gammaproteobacteria bacterium]|jgi:SAM-dependent methyltransferase
MQNQDLAIQTQPPAGELVPRRRAAELTPGFAPAAPDLGHSQGVHDSWREYFRALPVGARLLDVAAGIGAVALIAQEVSRSRSRGFEVHSLDQASTFNAGPLVLDGIRLYSRRYDQSTPFEDGYFDAVSAQWAPPDDGTTSSGIAELRRILKPGGRARFMFHALGGAAHAQCRGRIEAIRKLLDEFQLLNHAREMFEVAFTQETALKRDVVHAAMLAMDSQQRYAETVERIAGWNLGTPNPKAVDQILQLIAACWEQRRRMSYADIIAHLDQVEGEMRAAETRMRGACALAVDETRAHRIGRLFRSCGFDSVKVRPFKTEDVLVGWDLLVA